MHRRPLLVAALLVLLTTACGGDDGGGARAPGPDDDPTTTTDDPQAPGGEPEGELLAAEPLVVAEGLDSDPDAPGPGLLVDEVDLRAFAGRFWVGVDGVDDQLDEALDALEGHDLDGRVMVGGVVATGCVLVLEVELRLVDGDLRLGPAEAPDEAPEDGDVECVRAVTTVAVVSVDRDDLPDGVTVAGEDADAQVGPGEVVAFGSVDDGERPDAVEVIGFGQLDAVLDGIDGALPAGALGLDEAAPDVRRFVLVVQGCGADTAEILVAGEEITAVARQRGQEDGLALECEAPESYVVVADVASSASGGAVPVVD